MPTTVPSPLFSGRLKAASVATGASFTAVTAIEAVAAALRSVPSPVVEACTSKLAGPE